MSAHSLDTMKSGGGLGCPERWIARDVPLVPATTGPGPCCRDGMCLELEVVGQRVESRWLAAPPGDGLSQQPVRKPRIAGQKRPVQVRAAGSAGAAAFVSALAVVAEPRDDAAQRLGALVQIRAARVVLEACKRPALPGLQLARE